MSLIRISLILLGVLSGIILYAQESTYTSPQGIEFILIKPGSLVVGKFQPTVNRGGMGGFGGPPPGQGGRHRRHGLPRFACPNQIIN